MVGRLIFDQIFIFPFFKAKASPHKWRVENHIDFVEGQPVFDQTLVAGKEGAAEIFIEAQHLAAAPATVGFNQVHRAVKVGDGD